MKKMIYEIQSDKYKQLFILGKRCGVENGYVSVIDIKNNENTFYFKFDDFEPCVLKLDPNTAYTIKVFGVEIALSYFFGNNDILDEGVLFAFFKETLILYNKNNIGELYNQKHRNQFHFTPISNWLNDPNGACWYKGYYHLFYQYNPTSQSWGNPYWGHAVSKDMITWVHLPIVLFPQVELIGLTEHQGGAYSGSAVVEDDHIRFFFTRHIGLKDRSWQRQWQCTAVSYDGVTFENEKPLITSTPKGVQYDFRDPKVEWINGKWRMLLSGKVDDKPKVMLYNSNNLEDWEYSGIILADENPYYSISECPDIFELDGKMVMIVGYVTSDEIPHGAACKTRRVTCYYIGNLVENKFRIDTQGILDRGQDFYSAQTFRHENRRIMYAWNNDSPHTHIFEKGGSNGSICIPRELRINDNHLYSYPIEEIKLLEKEILFEKDNVGDLEFKEHNSNSYSISLDNINSSEFEMILTEKDTENVSLKYINNTVWLHCGKDNYCSCHIESLEKLKIYMDRAIIEVFINNGQESFNRRYYLENPRMKISIKHQNKKHAMSCKIQRMDRMWKC